MIIVVTGAFGFIGSNLVKALNDNGYKDIIAVDDLTDGSKSRYLNNCDILDYVDKEDFIQAINNGDYDNQIDYIFHQGACAVTTECDGRYMMKNNYDYSSTLLKYAQHNEVPFVYASSAAVYGNMTDFIEDRDFEYPLNIYAYSKFLFDQLVRRYYKNGLSAPVVGIRYFNVYGNNENHKGHMASVVWHHFNQLQQNGYVKLFEGCGEYANGEQLRDFISIEDVIKVNMFFFKNHLHDKEEISGILNCGTGRARTFNDLAAATINAYYANHNWEKLSVEQLVDKQLIRYIPFPQELASRYQSFTQANLAQLYEVGYKGEFVSLEEGVNNYIRSLLRCEVE